MENPDPLCVCVLYNDMEELNSEEVCLDRRVFFSTHVVIPCSIARHVHPKDLTTATTPIC